MKNAMFFIFLVFVLAGCQKSDRPKTEIRAIQPAPSREERKATAVAEVKSAEKEKAGAKVKVDLSPLKGNKLGDLYAAYLDIPKGELAPPSTVVSFDEVMAHLYQKKVNFERCNKKTKECTEASETVLSQAPDLYKHYLGVDKKKMSFKEFIAVANKKVASAKRSLDWAKVCKRYSLNQKRCSLLLAVVSNLTGKDMIAYGMAELLPSAQGGLNVKYMDILLRNAGAEFLYHIPALGDGLASLGPYQFTMYSIRNDEGGKEGASVINSFVRDGGEKIPDSVVLLRGHEHHVAAFYFAVHNLARLISSLSATGVRVLAKTHSNYQDEMVMYIAAAHHAPSPAIKKTASWINHGLKTKLLAAYRGLGIHQYAVKTNANLIAIYKRK